MATQRKPPVFTPSPIPVRNGDIIAWARIVVGAMFKEIERNRAAGK